MAEYYPDNATLLALTEDEHTGGEYIPTGLSPYFVEYRQMQQRLMLAAARASDLRVHQDGDLSVGVRAGRCAIAGNRISFNGSESISVASEQTTYLWLDSSGILQSSTTGWPTDRIMVLPIAQVTAGESSISSVTDVRGETFLSVQYAAEHVQYIHGGEITSSETDQLMGMVAGDAVVSDIVLSIGANIQSSVSSDGLVATVKVNDAIVTTVNPSITANDGAGFRSTAGGDGVAAIIKTDGGELVSKGDVLTVDIARTAGGTVSVEAADVVVMVVMHAI